MCFSAQPNEFDKLDRPNTRMSCTRMELRGVGVGSTWMDSDGLGAT